MRSETVTPCPASVAVHPVLEARGIAKSYGPTCAIKDGNLRLLAGHVHALLGENGAGKSTLVKIMVGAVTPDSGSILLDGETVRFDDVREAIVAGVVPIYQHLSLFPHLTVRENLSAFAIAAMSRGLAAPALVTRTEARAALDAVGLACDLDGPVGALSLGERQLVEIARGICGRCKVLVLDEPTAALTHAESERLFAVIRRLCGQGTAVLFISHKMDEVEALADDVTVLRDGYTVIDGQPGVCLNRSALVHAMLGDVDHVVDRDLVEPGEIVLRARGLRTRPEAPPMDIEVRQGEIVGLAGLVGSGVLEIAAALAGAISAAAGELSVAGQPLPGSAGRDRAIALGIGYIPGDRHAEGLFAGRPALHNASVSTLDAICAGGLLRRRSERDLFLPWLERLRLHPLRPDMAAAGFSGGNQQKLLVARNLAIANLRVLVILEPTRGVDVGARQTIHDAIIEAANCGVAVVLASSDLDEVTALAHRVLVVRQGRIEGELPRGAARSVLMESLAGRSAA